MREQRAGEENVVEDEEAESGFQRRRRRIWGCANPDSTLGHPDCQIPFKVRRIWGCPVPDLWLCKSGFLIRSSRSPDSIQGSPDSTLGHPDSKVHRIRRSGETAAEKQAAGSGLPDYRPTPLFELVPKSFQNQTLISFWNCPKISSKRFQNLNLETTQN
jgi:hypothetical protein